MPETVIDEMSSTAPWTVEDGAGGPSTELVLATDSTHFRFGSDQTSLRLDGTTGVSGHVALRTAAATDLSDRDELRLWARSDRTADGSDLRPYFLELRLGSAALPVDDAGNDWHRFLPFDEPDKWTLVRCGLDDLPDAARTAITQTQLRSVDAASPFTVHLDDLVAVREEIVADADAGLHALFHNRMSLGGTPVPAHHRHPDNPTAHTQPFIEITHFDSHEARDRHQHQGTRTDFTSAGFRERPPRKAYDLDYTIDAFAATRIDKARIQSFLLGVASSERHIVVNRTAVSIEPFWFERSERPVGSAPPRAPIHLRVRASLEVGTARPVVPVHNEVRLEVEQPSV